MSISCNKILRNTTNIIVHVQNAIGTNNSSIENPLKKIINITIIEKNIGFKLMKNIQIF